MTERARGRHQAPGRYGVWLFGARGGLATTTFVGARAIARGLRPATGLVTETGPWQNIDLVGVDDLVFGGHELRDVGARAAASEIHERAGTIPYQLIEQLGSQPDDFASFDAETFPGCMANAGGTIEKLVGEQAYSQSTARESTPLREQIERLRTDIRGFRARHRLDGVTCVLLTSTEPTLELGPAHATLEALDAAIDRDDATAVRPSLLYAYTAASLGLPLIHFTPSNAALVPAVRELFDRENTPYMGSDGKTGETLVKSALAPMFRHRALRVLSWQGYNILGDRDGIVLADEDNKRAKVESKDAILPSILGHQLHTHVGIDYVPSLDDLKTAWDFIHFEGFLGHRMAMQFTWQGADAILAAPLVLDMVRLAELATRRGEKGPMHHLGFFFKRPLEVDEHDLHVQAQRLTRYAEELGTAFEK